MLVAFLGAMAQKKTTDYYYVMAWRFKQNGAAQYQTFIANVNISGKIHVDSYDFEQEQYALSKLGEHFTTLARGRTLYNMFEGRRSRVGFYVLDVFGRAGKRLELSSLTLAKSLLGYDESVALPHDELAKALARYRKLESPKAMGVCIKMEALHSNRNLANDVYVKPTVKDALNLLEEIAGNISTKKKGRLEL